MPGTRNKKVLWISKIVQSPTCTIRITSKTHSSFLIFPLTCSIAKQWRCIGLMQKQGLSPWRGERISSSSITFFALMFLDDFSILSCEIGCSSHGTRNGMYTTYTVEEVNSKDYLWITTDRKPISYRIGEWSVVWILMRTLGTFPENLLLINQHWLLPRWHVTKSRRN